MKTTFFALLASLAITTAATAQQKSLPVSLSWGPIPYVGFQDSPFRLLPHPDRWLHRFESRHMPPDFIFTAGGYRAKSRFTDSVDEDDRKIDGKGDGGSFRTKDTPDGVTFIFNPNEYGGYPQYAGIVTTDNCPCTVTFMNPAGRIIATIVDPVSNEATNTTDDDRFSGAFNTGGIGRIRVVGANDGGAEMDHIQYASAVPWFQQGDFWRDGEVDIIDWETIAGYFHRGDFPSGTLGPNMDFNGNGKIDEVDLNTFWQLSPRPNGDLDGDGSIDFADFLTFSENFSRPNATYEQGDLDGNGIVEFADFITLSTNFGKTWGDTAPVSVPEPSSAVLGLLSLTLLMWRR